MSNKMEEEQNTSSVTGRKLFVLWVIFLGYLLLGGLIFNVLEKENEDNQRVIARDTKRMFMMNYTCLSQEALEDLINALLLIQDQGVDPRGNATAPSKWDFTSSLFFSGTVVTTIGYGNITPSSRSGQQFCIFYALIGIPLCGFVLAGLGERIKNYSLKFKERVTAVCKKKKLKRPELFYMGMICISGFFIFFAIPAVIFAHVENWSFHTSFYYTFITLSTIGFGDYVAGTNSEKSYNFIYRFLVYVWILFGLVYFILLLGHVSDLIETAGRKIKKKTASIKEKRHKHTHKEDENKDKIEEIKADDDNGTQEKISLQPLGNSLEKVEADVNVAAEDIETGQSSPERSANSETEIII